MSVVLPEADADRLDRALAVAAQALHDGPMQDLIAARYQLDLTIREHPVLATTLAAVREALIVAIARTRELTTTLRSGS